MHDFHHLSLDGQLLQTLVAIVEEASVTKAAIRLDINQSTLSHRLERLRSLVGHPIFVRAGRGIVPTPRAYEIAERARDALEAMRLIMEPSEIDPIDIDGEFVIGATDYERSVFLLDAYKGILERAPRIQFQFVWERYEISDELRKNIFDMSISPLPALSDKDIRHQRLFDDRIVCFYDASVVQPPRTIEQYTFAKHVRIIFSDKDYSFVDRALASLGVKRHAAINMPSISELPYLMKGTNLIATVPSRLKNSIMSDFSVCPLPFEIEPLSFKLFWHDRTDASKKHVWLRNQIFDAANKLPTLAKCGPPRRH